MPTAETTNVLRTQIAGLPVAELARQFGTPTYVYDGAQIAERIEDLRAFDVIRYSQKACSNLGVLSLVRRLGALVDSVSAGELRRARAVGYSAQGDPPPIVYTADIFSHEALDLVVEHQIHTNVGSPDMIDQLAERASDREITLRINPGFGHGHSQKTNTGGSHSKHGIWHTQLGECLRRSGDRGLRVTGLHMHIGSGTDLEHLGKVCGAMEMAAIQVGPTIRSISAGGGLPVPYQEGDSACDLDAYYRLWDEARKRLQERFGHPVSLEIEPGRYVAAESGFLVSQIRAIKRVASNTFYLLDAGFNTLSRPILYGAYHPMSIALCGEGQFERPLQDVVVGGPLCESGDIFTQTEGGVVSQRRLPTASVGDFLIIERAGAYGAVMSSNYNSQPMAAEVLVLDGKPHLVRARQTFEDMIRGEAIPP